MAKCKNEKCKRTDAKHLESVRVLTSKECVEVEITLCKDHFVEVMKTLFENIRA